MWYGLSLLFQSIKVHASTPNTWEEIILLVEADSEEEALEAGTTHAKSCEDSYEAVAGNTIHWKFVKIVKVFPINEDILASKTEVFCRYLSEKAVSEMLKPLD